MTRLLILLCLALAVYHALGIGFRLLLGVLRRSLDEGAGAASSGPLKRSGTVAGSRVGTREELVPCATCGVHIARKSAKSSPPGSERLFYCSDVCQEQA
jgi:hypothetical protein